MFQIKAAENGEDWRKEEIGETRGGEYGRGVRIEETPVVAVSTVIRLFIGAVNSAQTKVHTVHKLLLQSERAAVNSAQT